MYKQFDQKEQKIICSKCGYSNYDNEQNEQGFQSCKKCGYVISDDAFDNNPTFIDTKITGQTHELLNLGRDNMQKAEDYITTMINDLKIKKEYPEYLDLIGETPLRIMKFAYKAQFLDHGSNIHHYSAAALYISLRFQKAPFLLMDFSDKLCINLFKLARCYRKLAKFLNITLKLNEKLPSIDPSIYIPRFCKMLDFNEKVDLVKETAIKLLKRMKLDWMSHGRRPSSLCGAAILISARMHGFKRTTSEVCKVVYVCEETLRKRLEEFKETDVAKLTREKFEEVQDIEQLGKECDPPAFQKAQKNQIKMIENQQIQQQQQDLQLDDQKQIITEENIQQLEDTVNIIDKNIEKIEGNQANNNNFLSLNISENLSELSDSEVNQFILSNDEHQMKSKMWHQMNDAWLREQQRKNPKDDQKEGKKRNKRRNDQLMNEDDPVDAMLKSKKMNKLDEKKLRELLKKIDNIKKAKFEDIFPKSKEEKPIQTQQNKILQLDDEFIRIAQNQAQKNIKTNTFDIKNNQYQHDDEDFEYE